MTQNQQQQEAYEKVVNSGAFKTMRIIPVVMGFIFAGIGLTVLIALWSAKGFGAPPLFFKIFGSFIAIAFVTVGTTTAIAVLKGGSLAKHLHNLPQQKGMPSHSGQNFNCPSCGAALPSNADISPSGDVKCTYCNSWFNTH